MIATSTIEEVRPLNATNATPRPATGTGSAHSPSAAIDRVDADILATVLESLEESKAEEIAHIDIRGKSPVADHMVVTSGRSHRHVNAVADRLLRDLKDAGFGTPKIEGMPACDWVLIDTGDVIVHVFRPEVRDFYSLEKLWTTIADGEPS